MIFFSFPFSVCVFSSHNIVKETLQSVGIPIQVFVRVLVQLRVHACLWRGKLVSAYSLRVRLGQLQSLSGNLHLTLVFIKSWDVVLEWLR